MAKTHEIDGKTYVEVERKAEIGDYVVMHDYWHGKDGDVLKVDGIRNDCYFFEGKGVGEGSPMFIDGRGIEGRIFNVLEPVESEAQPLEDCDMLTANDIRWQPDRVIDMLANLARRVSSLERQVDSMSTQLADTQGNVQRQAEELENEKEYRTLLYRKVSDLKDQVESNESDIVMLDERTASHRDELNVIDHEKDMIFADIVSLSDRIRKLNGGAAE